MSLVILKNQPYEKFKESPQADSPSGHLRVIKRVSSKKRRVIRRARQCSNYLLVISLVVLAALIYSPFQENQSESSEPVIRRTPVVRMIEESVSQGEPVWRCKGATFTNNPSSTEECEYLGSSGGEAGSRFITPGQPDRS